MTKHKATNHHGPARHRRSGQPDAEHKMRPKPRSEDVGYRGSGKLINKVALITGGDSGIGRAVAIAFAAEGANVAITYLHNHKDAKDTKSRVERDGRRCIAICGDVGAEAFCHKAVEQTVRQLGRLDILVNNAAEQQPQVKPEAITSEQLKRTFRTNILSCFYATNAALPHLKKGSTIINTTSVTAYRGSLHLTDYSATKGAIVAFTRSPSKNVVQRGIRVNGVAPGPIWTPLIPSRLSTARMRSELRAPLTYRRPPGRGRAVSPWFSTSSAEAQR